MSGIACLLGLFLSSGCARDQDAAQTVDDDAAADAEIAAAKLEMTRRPMKGRSATTADVLEFLGPMLAPVISSPDHVLVHRIEKKADPSDPRDKIGGYPILRRGDEVDPVHRSRWSDSCTSPLGFYSLDWRLRNPDPDQGMMVAPCLFTPGYAVEFIKGSDRCFVLICLTCSEWKFLDAQNGMILHSEHFIHQAARIRGLAEISNPDDPAHKPDPRFDRPPRTPSQPITP